VVKTVAATYSRGSLKPARPLRLKEGQRVRLTIVPEPSRADAEQIIRTTSGAWADQLDCDSFEQRVYARRHNNRRKTIQL